MELTDAQWSLIEPLFPQLQAKTRSRGRPQKHPREVLNGILWVLKTGAQWHRLPANYPPYQTCHRWLQTWSRDGTFFMILQKLLVDLQAQGRLDLDESFVDGTFARAKKGAQKWPSEERAREAL